MPLVDVSLYVMTPEFGAASQLEKIDMLDFADLVAINKFDRKGAEDALRDVRKQFQRNRERSARRPRAMPVFGTIAVALQRRRRHRALPGLLAALAEHGLPQPGHAASAGEPALLGRRRHRAAGARRAISPRSPTACAAITHAPSAGAIARERSSCASAARMLLDQSRRATGAGAEAWSASARGDLDRRARQQLLESWPEMQRAYAGDEYVVDGPRQGDPHRARRTTTLSGNKHPQGRAAALRGPRRAAALAAARERARRLPLHRRRVRRSSAKARTRPACSRAKATPSAPTAASSSCRKDMPAKRLSTAFDSVTLYGCDPDERPDIYGKVGNSGVSIATLDDMKVLYDGFDLCAPTPRCR